MIAGMTKMIEQLLNYNHETSERLPTKIVFYRDGEIFFRLSFLCTTYLFSE